MSRKVVPKWQFFPENFRLCTIGLTFIKGIKIERFIFTSAPTSSTNPEEEDIDIVGCGEGDNGNKTTNSGNLSSSESSRDLQLHVYGPPQFTEADVLACMNTLEEPETEQDEEMADSDKKSTGAGEETETLTSTQVIKREMDSENEHEKNEDNKENIADKSKCSKCLVSKKLKILEF